MNDLGPLLVLLALAGVALTAVCGLYVRSMNPDRRVRSGLKKVLKVDPHALIVAPGRGKGAGFNFTSNSMAVTWEAGAWCLVYRVDELMGAEAIIDRQVAARVHRGEDRRALENIGGAQEAVRLRLIFDDAAYPDFELELWKAADANVRNGPTAAEATEEANRWIARVDALLRRPTTRKAPPPVPQAQVAQTRAAPPKPEPEPAPVRAAQTPPETEPEIELQPTPAPPPTPAAGPTELPEFLSPLRANDLPWDEDDRPARA